VRIREGIRAEVQKLISLVASDQTMEPFIQVEMLFSLFAVGVNVTRNFRVFYDVIAIHNQSMFLY